ncbi:MAG: ATP-binding domain-containing protein [Pseudanabaena sp.]
MSESSLCIEKLKELTGQFSQYINFENLLPNQESNLFVRNCLTVVQSIEAESFNNLQITSDQCKVIKTPNEIQFKQELIKDLFHNDLDNTKFIAFSNEQVNSFNSWLRQNLFGRDKNLAVGDIVHIHNYAAIEIEGNLELELSHIPNDSFVEILEVSDQVKPIKQDLKGRNNAVIVNFLKIKAKWEDCKFTCLCLKDYLYSEKPEVDKETLLALYVATKAKFDKNHRGSQSKDQESYKEGLANFLRNDLYFNAARLRFGYALTLHRAQGLQFQNIIANMETGQGQTNETYFRWLYTLFTVAENRIILSNSPEITPFSKARWDDREARLDSVAFGELIDFNPSKLDVMDDFRELNISDPALRSLYLYIKNAISNQEITIESRKSFSYQEIYKFRSLVNDESCSIRLNYNAKYKVKMIEIIKSSSPEFSDLVKGSIVSRVHLETEFQKQLFEVVQDKLSRNNIFIQNIEHKDFREYYYLTLDDNSLKISLDYNADGFITRLAPLAYTNKNILEKVRLVLMGSND